MGRERKKEKTKEGDDNVSDGNYSDNDNKAW